MTGRAVHAIERWLMAVNRLLAGVLAIIAITALYIGVTGGVLARAQTGRFGGHEVVVAMGLVLLMVAAALWLAGSGMQRRARWRWVAQCSPVLIYWLGFWAIDACVQQRYEPAPQSLNAPIIKPGQALPPTHAAP